MHITQRDLACLFGCSNFDRAGALSFFPHSNRSMYLFSAVVTIGYKEVYRHGFSTYRGNDDRNSTRALRSGGDGEIWHAIIEEPFFPEPVHVATGSFVHTVEEIIRHRGFAMPLLDVVMKGFRE